MKKTSTFTTIILLLFAVESGVAQSSMQDVVYLKNGNIVKGTIIEQVPKILIRIRSADGNIWTFQLDEIESIRKVDPQLNTANTLSKKSIEINAGIGYTEVDMFAWAGEGLWNYDQLMWHVDIQALFPLSGKISIGGEIGYQYLFWYERRTQIGSVYYYPYYEVDALRILAKSRYSINKLFFVDAGIGSYLFDEWSSLGLMSALGLQLGFGNNLSFSLKARTDIVIESDATLFPLGFSSGIAYNF